jgi:pentatricopeptide repeat protein
MQVSYESRIVGDQGLGRALDATSSRVESVKSNNTVVRKVDCGQKSVGGRVRRATWTTNAASESSNFFATALPSPHPTRHGSVKSATSPPLMPRARVPSARLTAGADTLILPWLAPRAFAESPVLRRRERRDGSSNSPREEQTQHSDGWVIAQRRQASSSNGASCRTPTRCSLDLRYADIASFARRHTRTYATAPEGRVDPFSQTQPLVVDQVASATRYSRRRSWKEQVAKATEGLDPQTAGRRRVKLLARAEERLQAQARRLQHDKRNYKHKPLYDGQYRSLKRLVLSLKRWDHTVANVTKYSEYHADDERWLLDAFAALDRNAYAKVNALTKPITIEHDPRCQTFTEELLDGVERDGAGRIWMNWHMFQHKQKYYETTLVYMLEHKPGYAQDLMTVLALDNELPQNKYLLLADGLAYLAKLHLKEQYSPGQGWEASAAANVRKFVTTFITCTEKVDAAVFSQDLLYSLVLLAGPSDLKKVYDALIKARTRLAIGTVLHYASAFAEAGETAYALQCLERRLELFNRTDRETFVASDVFRWTCAAVLRGSMRHAKNYHETPGIVAKFVEFGVKMDLLLYDVVMHNAMDAGDFATAFKVFNALEDNGLKADKHTYSILLHGCTTQSDPTMFKAFADFCLKKAKELEDPWLATDYLYYVYICEQAKPAHSQDTNLMWRTYLDLFDWTPLKPFTKLGSRAMRDAIDQDSETSASTPSPAQLAPTSQALYLMLQTELQSVQPLAPAYLEKLYQTFKRGLSSSAHPTLLALATKPLIWNAFLHAFVQKQQYASASQLIRDMSAHGTPPNVYSWNMLMQAFFKSGQVSAAERVRALMRARGVEPDGYTYGVMVRGYAKAQLVERIGETMQGVSEEEQLEPGLLRALSRVQARAELTESLERNRRVKESRDASAAAQKSKEEEDRFKIPGLKSLFARAVTFKEPTHWDHGSLEEADDFLEPDDEPAAVEPEINADLGDSESARISVDQTVDTVREEDEYLEPEDERIHPLINHPETDRTSGPTPHQTTATNVSPHFDPQLRESTGDASKRRERE